jgi:hypothetical protein
MEPASTRIPVQSFLLSRQGREGLYWTSFIASRQIPHHLLLFPGIVAGNDTETGKKRTTGLFLESSSGYSRLPRMLFRSDAARDWPAGISDNELCRYLVLIAVQRLTLD